METFQSLLHQKLAEALSAAGLPQAGAVTPATDARFGDYQTNTALVLGKQLGQDPRALAKKILDAYAPSDLCEPPTIAGAGFINFTLRPEATARKTADLLRDERLGVEKTAAAKRIVIDFGSPNVAKPMHVGHIRSTVLGDALARIAAFLGHESSATTYRVIGTQLEVITLESARSRALERDRFRRFVYKRPMKCQADPKLREAAYGMVNLQPAIRRILDLERDVDLSMNELERVIDWDIIRHRERELLQRPPACCGRALSNRNRRVSAARFAFSSLTSCAAEIRPHRKSDGGFQLCTTYIATVLSNPD